MYYNKCYNYVQHRTSVKQPFDWNCTDPAYSNATTCKLTVSRYCINMYIVHCSQNANKKMLLAKTENWFSLHRQHKHEDQTDTIV